MSGEQKKNLSLVVAGILVGCVVALLCFTCSQLMHRSDLKFKESSMKSDPIARAATYEIADCKSLDLKPAGDFCRSKEPIDFYIIEDISSSATTSQYDEISKEIQKVFTMEEGDRISCIGFGEVVLPERNLLPEKSLAGGCESRKNEISSDLDRRPGIRSLTRFDVLFNKLRITLKKERESIKKSAEKEYNHRDLIIIITDGVHDSVGSSADCFEQSIRPLPRAVIDQFNLFRSELIEHKEETWLFLVLTGYKPGCLAEIESSWKQNQEFSNLNIIAAQDGQSPQELSRIIFQSISQYVFALEKLRPSISPEERTRLDIGQYLTVDYRISPRPNQYTPIRKTIISYGSASLEGINSKSKINLGLQDRKKISGKKFVADISDESAALTFLTLHSSQKINPYENYLLKVDLEGITDTEDYLVLRNMDSIIIKRLNESGKFFECLMWSTALLFFLTEIVGKTKKFESKRDYFYLKLNNFLTLFGLTFLTIKAFQTYFQYLSPADMNSPSIWPLISLVAAVALPRGPNVSLVCIDRVQSWLGTGQPPS